LEELPDDKNAFIKYPARMALILSLSLPLRWLRYRCKKTKIVLVVVIDICFELMSNIIGG